MKVFDNYFFKLRFVQIDIFFGMFGRRLKGAKYICVKLIRDNFKENGANIFTYSFFIFSKAVGDGLRLQHTFRSAIFFKFGFLVQTNGRRVISNF